MTALSPSADRACQGIRSALFLTYKSNINETRTQARSHTFDTSHWRARRKGDTLSVMLLAVDRAALKKLRTGMTQAELAEKAGVARITVIRVEGGQTASLTFDTANRLAEALDVNVSAFVVFRTREEIEREKRQRKRRK